MFRDRKHAGELLAGLLGNYRGQAGTVVLGLARGGVPVDVFVVRKIGAPHQPELAIGAVASGSPCARSRGYSAMHVSQAALDLRVVRGAKSDATFFILITLSLQNAEIFDYAAGSASK